MKVCYEISSEDLLWTVNTDFVKGTRAHKTLSRVKSRFYCSVNSCTPSGNIWNYVTFHARYTIILSSPSNKVSFVSVYLSFFQINILN